MDWLPRNKILQGHVLDVLRTLPDGCVQMCVTSPPYWGLRDYGIPPQTWGGDTGCSHEWTPMSFCSLCGARKGNLGLEPTVDLYTQHIVEVFREVRRVLRGDGTLWMNVGDCYAQSGRGGMGHTSTLRGGKESHDESQKARHEKVCGLKAKDLVGLAWRVAFALQADGWYLRSDIIWHKPSCMPESICDRPTRSHEFVFLFSKRAKYYYDAEAIKEPAQKFAHPYDPTRVTSVFMRNKRSVWTIPSEPLALEHFAAYPKALVEPCVLAGTSEKGACSECGAPWRRLIAKKKYGSWHDHSADLTEGAGQGGTQRRKMYPEEYEPGRTVGWTSSCKHGDVPLRPCVVLDPFLGSGTTALVARRAGRDWIGVELSRKYCEIAKARLEVGDGFKDRLVNSEEERVEGRLF